jgi:prephenate dehydrogenase
VPAVRVAVVGLGLIGGSIGLAAGSRAGASVFGFDPDRRALAAAVELGAIDFAASELAGAVREADLAFVAAPVGALAQTVTQTLAAAGAGCVVSDVGSVKHELADAVVDPRFVGGHPMAGAESAGIEHARADLFDGANWYLTPSPDVPRPLLDRLSETIRAFGARPRAIDAAAHDRLMASLSHLPHVFANVLAEGAAAALSRERVSQEDGPFAGPSLRDATRVAGANTAIWADIYIANREALVAAIDEALGRLDAVRGALAGADAATIAAWNERARADRERLAAGGAQAGAGDAGAPGRAPGADASGRTPGAGAPGAASS